jgi:Glu-tRNA(Gln) amidotransferase subunit E-like FAD-binding protein
MPGSSRMYPETDVKPETIDQSKIIVPKLLSEKISELKDKFGLAEDIVKKTLKQVPDFLELLNQFPKVKPSYITDAEFSLQKSVLDISPSIDLSNDILTNPLNSSFMREQFLPKLNAGTIASSSLAESAVEYIEKGEVDWSKRELLSLDDIKEDVKLIVDSMREAPRGAIIGKVMAKYTGKVNGQELSKFINSLF